MSEEKRIHVLDKKVAELIAAGEVVERPASAVKELLENAIDAGASMITLEIKNGGITFIRVTDDGCGIERADVGKAFLRHATSKILTENDLSSIGTLGFRGEALASISAVSKTELITRTEKELAGTHLCLEGSVKTSLDDAGCPRGTTIIVRELFYNTPARMKFLKKDTTEGNAVAAVIQRIALSHPEVSMRFIKDGREELHTPGDNKLFSAIHSVLGKDFARSLIEIKYSLGHITVDGFITKPLGARSNRNMQFFFLNGRLVKSKTMMAALEEAYKGSIMVGKYPGCVIRMTINPSLVDVNVHPAKLEVRFSDEKEVFESVYYAVKNAVSKADERPDLEIAENKKLPVNGSIISNEIRYSPNKPSDNGFTRAAFSAGGYNGFKSDAKAEPAAKQMEFILKNTPLSKEQEEPFSVKSSVKPVYEPVSGGTINLKEEKPSLKENEPPQAATKTVEEPKPTVAVSESAENKNDVRVIGQCFGTYILAEKGNSLYVIDKHAAHERILYEKLKKEGSETSQMLLEPVTVRLPAEEYSAVVSNLGLLEKAGIGAEDFGNFTVLVRSAPLDLAGAEISGLIEETASNLAQHKKDLTPAKLDWVFHSVACRAAIKAHDRTLMPEMQRLAERILNSSDILYCPHGRPVAFELTKGSLEKKFGR